MKKVIACSSVQPGNPAMSGDLSAQGIGTVGLNGRTAPFNSFPATGLPC
jgi:hypothetical protein